MIKLKRRNEQLDAMAADLEPLLKQRNKIGYAAARNTRILNDVLTEYHSFKNQLIVKYGKEDRDEEGRLTGTVSIRVDTPEFKQFCDEVEEYSGIEHEIELMTLSCKDVIGILSGEEILNIDWMLEDKEDIE